jgi:membrane carboxypeptidase/penicillin-binding protein
VAVWIGFDQGRSLGPGESGSIAAAPVVRDFFEIALKGRKGHEFEPPKGLVRVRIELPPKKNEATSGEGDDDVGLDGEEQPLRVVYEYLKVNPTTPNAVVVVMRGSQVEVVGGERGDDAGSGNSIKQDAVAGITKERMRQRAQRNRPSQRNRHPTWVDRPDSSYRNY